ncbi:MAG: PAS domain-containing sensor histidine kinase, partial [Ramlibacter sp.]
MSAALRPPPGAAMGARRISAFNRWSLWTLLAALVVALLATLVWLAGRYEASQVQEKLERDAADALGDVRSALTRNVQSLQALQTGQRPPASWNDEALSLLRTHREWMRIEWRDAGLRTLQFQDTPYRSPVFARLGRANAQSDVALACANGRRVSGPAYSTSY